MDVRIVQSFWFAPTRSASVEGFAGFPDERLFWYAWALSLGLLKKHFREVCLYTDAWGQERVSALGLHHSAVYARFNDLKGVPHQLWAIPKLLIYAEQRQPFWHVDTDAFLLEPPSETLLRSPIVCQGPETHPEQVAFYRRLMVRLRKELAWLPTGYQGYDPEELPPLNCGIVGGTAVELLRKYAEESLKIFTHPENQSGWRRLAEDDTAPLAHFNCAIEQVNLALHCRAAGIVPRSILGASKDQPRFVHLVGGDKTHPESLSQVEVLVSKRMPQAKERIDGFFRKERVSASAKSAASLINRAIHSFWFSEPVKGAHDSFGFPSRKSFWYAWVLSFWGLKNSFSEVILYTSPYGRRVVNEVFKLPYSEVNDLPPHVNEIPQGAWNGVKFLVYLAQNMPFVHVDTDAILWAPFPDRLRKSSVVAERQEWSPENRSFYVEALRVCKAHLPHLPSALARYDAQFSRGYAVNCGVLGGTNLEVLHTYARLCLELLVAPANTQGFETLATKKDELSSAVIAIEQLLLLDVCDTYRVMPKYLLEACPLS